MSTDKLTEAHRLDEVYRLYKSSNYSSKWAGSNPGNIAMLEERFAAELDFLRRHRCLPDPGTKALDFGCGSGSGLDWLCKLGGSGANFYGVDIRSQAVDSATKAYPHLNFCRAGEAKLPFADGFFDYIKMNLVLSSILDAHERTRVCGELNRTLRSGAAIMIYDFRVNNPGNRNVRGVKRREIQALFPNYEFDFRSLTVVPPIARKLGGLCSLLYPALRLFPFLRTHNMCLGIKNGER